jgi:hypothetical protein
MRICLLMTKVLKREALVLYEVQETDSASIIKVLVTSYIHSVTVRPGDS